MKKKKNIKLLLKRNVKRCLSLWIKKYGVSEDEEKKIAFKYFVDRHIPHTETLYKDGELIKIIDRYDCYVTGSDQVWNPVSMDDNFFLEFVSNKKKIAYASSLGADVIEPVLLEQICKKISSFHFVSVREKSYTCSPLLFAKSNAFFLIFILFDKKYTNKNFLQGGIIDIVFQSR